MKCIVSTGESGRVFVTHPTREFLAFFTSGGAPDGYFGRTLDRDWEVEKSVRAGRRPQVAHRWLDALISGGLTDAEAYELFRDRDTNDDWTAKELLDPGELPDRWFRNAWTRSHNGGPIDISMRHAPKVQLRRITQAKELRLRTLATSLDTEADRLRDEINSLDVRPQLRLAQTPEELRAVWPAILGEPRDYDQNPAA